MFFKHRTSLYLFITSHTTLSYTCFLLTFQIQTKDPEAVDESEFTFRKTLKIAKPISSPCINGNKMGSLSNLLKLFLFYKVREVLNSDIYLLAGDVTLIQQHEL